MNRALWMQSLRGTWWLLVACSVLIFAFIWFRLWIVSHIDFDAASKLISQMMPQFLQQLLPVPIEVMTSSEGRIVFGYEELPVLLLMALWSVSLGTDCLAGRLGDGTMEMLLAQPVRRVDVVVSHTGVGLAGVVVVASATWLAMLSGLATLDFGEGITTTTYLPAYFNLLSVGVFFLGTATLASAVVNARSQAVALIVGFYVVEFTCRVMGMLSPQVAWLKRITFMSLYQPTLLTIGTQTDPATYRPLLWQYNVTLTLLGLGAIGVAAVIFCRRDLPAPL